MPAIYDGYELLLTIDGAAPDCLEGITLSEFRDLVPGQRAPLGWEQYRPNLYGFSISFSGINQGGYLVLLGTKRALQQVDWVIRTADNARQITGKGYITEISRGETEGEYQVFNGQLTGYGSITNL